MEKKVLTRINLLILQPWEHDWGNFVKRKVRNKNTQRPTFKKINVGY